MNLFTLAVLMTGLCAVHAGAQATYDATITGRYVDLDSKGNKQQAMEFDGKKYRGGEGDVSVSNQGEKGLFDFTLKDIGTTEEVMNFALDYKSALKVSAKWENMHHRMNPLRHGQIVNGQWRPNNIGLTTGAERFTYVTGPTNVFTVGDPNNLDYKFKRTESEVNAALYAKDNSAKWLSVQFWNVIKRGSKYSQTATNNVGEGDVNNTKTDLTLGLGTNVGELAAMSLDIIRSEFRDDAEEFKIKPANVVPLLPHWSDHQMTGAELKWKYNVDKKLSLTGAITGRQRENLINQYKANIGVLAVNAAYVVSDKLSIVNRLYTRYFEIDENPGFRGFNASGASGNTHEFDKLHVRDEVIANFHPTDKIHAKASYKLEVIHRRDAPSQEYTLDALFNNGVFIPKNTMANNTANDETKHTANVAVTVELPLGIEAEAGYKKFLANRPAFINQATHADDLTARIAVPLPGHVEWMVGSDYTKEWNAKRETNYHLSRNAYYTGLDWDHNNTVFLGADGSYEIIKYNMDEYYQMGNLITTNLTPPGNTNIAMEPGALHRQWNTTVGAHARVVCPKGFVVRGNGSYTWSIVRNPTANIGWDAVAAASLPANGSAFTPPGTFVNDIQPSEVRVARGMIGVDYTPTKFKNLTAHASYSVTDWVDKIDPFMSGQARVAMVGATMKF